MSEPFLTRQLSCTAIASGACSASCTHTPIGPPEVNTATLRLPYNPAHLRPGGVINGPAIMAVADYCMYALALSIDPRGHGAVTTSMTMNFLRKTTGRDLLAQGRVLKTGRSLAFMETTVYADGEPDPVAHVTGTYAFPRAK